nr:LuxR C-terminal-related transcriptional regulator [uncultured Blautia sp.]
MANTLKEFEKLLHLALDRKVTMHRKLMMYLLCLILAALGILLLLLTAIGGPLKAEPQIAQMMENQLSSVSDKVSKELEAYTGYGLQLSRELGQDIEEFLDEKGMSVSDLNDRPELLLEIQKMMYSELNTTIRLGRSSGVFALVNATINTQIPEADQSRCGVYLRLINVSSNVILSPETILFRGNTEIARENGLELHNRWNMELNTEGLLGYQELETGLGQSESGYYWISRMNLKNTWEDVILLLVPMYTDTGEFLGACGIELNAVHFSLEYPATDSSYGSVVTVIAPVENGNLRLDQGMAGNTEGTWLGNAESLSIIEKNAYYSTYRSSKCDYYGIQMPLEIPGSSGQEWAVAVLIPRESCDQYILRNKAAIMGVILGFVLIMIALAWLLSKKFVRPILQGFQDIRDGQQTGDGKYRFAELEELCRWLAERGNPPEAGDIPPNMAELFERFAQNVKTLTNAEYNIFRYYMNGYEVAQIPTAACVSMSTVKKHNGNIYRKLEISSNEELMMYLDLFRRCDCIEKLQLDEKTDVSGIETDK